MGNTGYDDMDQFNKIPKLIRFLNLSFAQVCPRIAQNRPYSLFSILIQKEMWIVMFQLLHIVINILVILMQIGVHIFEGIYSILIVAIEG